MKRVRLLTTKKAFLPGQRRGQTARGGGGPENVGAVNPDSGSRGRVYIAQPPHADIPIAFNEYLKYAAPSTSPTTAGMKANDFRSLGDNFGGRG